MYIIYSKDYFLLTKQTNKLIKTLQAKEPDLEISYYSWLDDNIDEIIQYGNTYDLFGNKKLLVIKDCLFLTNKSNNDGVNNADMAPKLLEFSPENTIVIFLVSEDELSNKTKVAKLFKDKCEIIQPTIVNEPMIHQFVTKKLALANKQIDDEALDVFIGSLPMDMTIINTELTKLLGLNDAHITKEVVLDNISKYSESNIFNLSDYFTQNKTKEFINELHNYFDQNNDLLSLLFLLGTNLSTTRDVFILHNQGKSEMFIAEKLGIHPYRTKMILKNNHHIDIDGLNDKILLLYDLYNALMSGTYPLDVIPELELVKIIESNK